MLQMLHFPEQTYKKTWFAFFIFYLDKEWLFFIWFLYIWINRVNAEFIYKNRVNFYCINFYLEIKTTFYVELLSILNDSSVF